ncbi:MAG: cation transporter [Treponema sp.]|nr:cation transporter [Treponema sp.]
MIRLLAKLFIKNNKDYKNQTVREKYGILCGGFGIFLNVILFALKFIFGTIAASVAMVADAFNNLSDAASSIVQILGFKLASKKPDSQHPFGHGRLEYVSGLAISFFILLMGFELIKSSITKLINPEPQNYNLFSILVMGFAILIKFYMYLYNHQIAKKIDSVTMEATAKDSFSDMISTSVVIVSIIISRITSFPVDGIAGIIVGAFILKTGYEAAKDTIGPLLGNPPSKELVDEIEKELLKYKPIIGMHDLIVHDYGPGRMMISLHAEVPGDMNIFDLHDVIDVAEVMISRKFNCSVVIHMDPIDTNNTRLEELKKILAEELPKIDKNLRFHDVRMVPGPTHTNLIFDVVKPFECALDNEQLIAEINEAVQQRDKSVFCAVTVDAPYV